MIGADGVIFYTWISGSRGGVLGEVSHDAAALSTRKSSLART